MEKKEARLEIRIAPSVKEGIAVLAAIHDTKPATYINHVLTEMVEKHAAEIAAFTEARKKIARKAK